MAWIAFTAGVFYPGLVLFSDSEQISIMAGPYLAFLGTVVAVYIGAASYEHTHEKQPSEEVDIT